MRRLALLSLLLAVTSAPAAPLGESLYPGLMEFNEAYELYTAGDFERARTGFRHLAELGDPEAQLNLGVMLAKGEGGPTDRIEGAAWVRLAEAARLEQATAIRKAIESRLEPEQLDEIVVQLKALRPLPEPEDMNTETGENGGPDSRLDCIAENIVRVNPQYPREAYYAGEVGVVKMDLVFDPDGTVGAVHSLYRLNQNDDLSNAAWRAVTRWHASKCPSDSHLSAAQQIDFFLPSGSVIYTKDRREDAARLVVAARDGDAVMRFRVALLADGFPSLFAMPPADIDAMMLEAAVEGLVQARHWLWLNQGGAKAGRWAILAARQGFASALYHVSSWNDLPGPERRAALLEAAQAGHGPAILRAVRWLATHPDSAERDGTLALELITDLPSNQLKQDLLLAQAHAMALAETGQLSEAVRLQKRVLRILQGTGRGTRLARQRLEAYEAGHAWRDPTVAEEIGFTRND